MNPITSANDDSESWEGELEEMMVIEINFGKDRSDEILVHFGDDPEEIAKVLYCLIFKFTAAHRDTLYVSCFRPLSRSMD